MNTKLISGAIAAAVAVLAQGAYAQSTAPASRAEVKAEAKTGPLAPAGQGPGNNASSPNTSGMSTKTRMDRKNETASAKATGSLKPAGEASELKTDAAERSKGTMRSREDRKNETKQAVKAGTIQPAGEAPQPSAEPPKK